jgi:hypothetical protein
MLKYDLEFKFGNNKNNNVKYSRLSQCFWFESNDGEQYAFLLEDLKEFLSNDKVKEILK